MPDVGPMKAEIEACLFWVTGSRNGENCAFSHLVQEESYDIREEFDRLKAVKAWPSDVSLQTASDACSRL